MQVNVKLNNSGVLAGLRQLREVSPKLSRHLVNKACWGIAHHASKTIPIVTPDRIQAEMEAYRYVSKTRATKVSKAMFIVLASMYPGSRFNRETGGVFARVKPVFSGDGPTRRLQFWEWVNSRAERMISARRRSSGFFNFGAQVVKFIFAKTESGMPIGASGETLAGGGKVSKAINRVAGGTRATSDGKGNAKASFWVSTTEPDSKGANKAIERVMVPHWQRAVDAEAAGIARHAEELYVEQIRKAGFKVS